MTPAAFTLPLAAASAALFLAALPAAAAPQRSQTAALEGDHLFISPSGKPFRSVSGQPYPVVLWFKEADADHDGRIDKAEFHADAESFFHVLDRNGDGLITDDEIAFYEKTLVPELNASGEQTEYDTSDKTKLDKALEGAAPYALINDAEPVRSADDSFVGRITLKAFLKRADHNFDTLDADQGGHGYLRLEALPRTQVQAAAEPVRSRR